MFGLIKTKFQSMMIAIREAFIRNPILGRGAHLRKVYNRKFSGTCFKKRKKIVEEKKEITNPRYW